MVVLFKNLVLSIFLCPSLAKSVPPIFFPRYHEVEIGPDVFVRSLRRTPEPTKL